MRWILILLLFEALAHEIPAEDLHEKDAANEHVFGNNLEPDNKYNANKELESNLVENDDTLEKREVHEDRSKRAVNEKTSEAKKKKKKKGKNGKKLKKGKKQKRKKNIRNRKNKSTKKKNKDKKVKDKKGKKKKTKQKKLSSGRKKKKRKKKKKKKKKQPPTIEGTPENKAATNNDATGGKGPGRASADEALYTGPWGFQNPDLIDWTKPEYRCPECEDTLILYDPWWAPPPILHIPIYCTSNLSSQAASEGVHNWGPNLTFIWIPGSLNCTNKKKLRNDVQFSVEISQNTTATKGTDQTYYDCGENEAPNELEVGCQEEIIEHHTNKTSHTCFWHMYAYQHWRRQLEFTHWQLPINDCDPTPDAENKVRGLGECCESGPHLKISWTGYAKGFKSYCGPDEPVFYKTPFDKGRARWLIIYNNTHEDHSQHDDHLEFDFKAHTIGYRRTAAIDQYYYGTRCECGLKPKKPNTKMIAETKPGKKKNERTKAKKGKKKKKKNKKNKKKKNKKNKKKNNKKSKKKKKQGRNNKKKKNVRNTKKQGKRKGKGKKDKKEKKGKKNAKIKQKNKKAKEKEKNNNELSGLLARSQRQANDIKKQGKSKNKNDELKDKNKKENIKKPKRNKKGKMVKKKEKQIRKNKRYKKIKKLLRKKKKGKRKKGKKKKENANNDPLYSGDYDYESEYYDIKGPQSRSAKTAQLRAESPGDPTERTVGEWPWITSLTYDNKYVCSGYIVSPKFVVAVTKCFHVIDGMSATAINATLTPAELSKIEVVVYDKVVGKDESHEAKRSVTKVFVNSYCDPSRLPQHCVLLLQLNQAVDFGINGDIWGKPKAVCSTCVVSTFDIDTPRKAYPVKLRGYPFLVSYGLRDNQQEIKYGTYKNNKFLNSRMLDPDTPANQHGYLEKSDCPFLTRVGDHFNNITEWYCIPQMGNKYTCDKDTVTVGGTPVLGTRDYGAPLFQRIGRSGYKITWQVIAILWDFQCGQGGNAAYIPTWGFTQWVTDTIWANDEPCIKRVRKSVFTAKVSQDGKGPYPEHNMTKPN